MLSPEEVNSALMGICVCQRNVISYERECWTRQHRGPWLHQALKSQQVVASSQFLCMLVQNSTCRNWLFFFFVVHENLTSQNPESLLVILYSICLVYMYSIYSICLVSTIPIHFFLHWYDMEDEKASFTNTLMLLFNGLESVVSWRLFFFLRLKYKEFGVTFTCG